MNWAGISGFHEAWLERLQHLMNQMTAAARSAATPEVRLELEDLAAKAMAHYTEYHQVRAVAAERDAVAVLSAPWATDLERSLLWMAGWRPTTAFHIMYSESSIKFESHIVDILRGVGCGGLGDLSPAQLRHVSDLQCDTVKEENAITEEFSEWQDSASKLLHATKAELNDKIRDLVTLLAKADDLRLRTVQCVVDLLTPQQAVEFLIAAVELQLGVHNWGIEHDVR